MIEYRERVPQDAVDDYTAWMAAIDTVCENLSRQASPRQGRELMTEALGNVSFRRSRDGGVWVHSFLERDAEAAYLTEQVPPQEYQFATGHAYTKRPAVDLDPDEYARHLAGKNGAGA